MKISIGVFCVNEEANIEKLVSALLTQKTNIIEIEEIFVVSSGSTDRTNEIVKSFISPRVKLIVQEERQGKASAINLFLKEAKSEIVVIESGDTLPHPNCVEELCKSFEDKNLGLTGVRSIPTNNKNTLLGYIIHYWWWMHNELPRFGEMIAYRKELCPQISDKTAVDEAYIEAVITNKGYEKRQIPTAIVNNHGAENIKDLIKQRKRVYIGHKLLESEKNYSVQSFNISRILKLTLKYIKQEKSIKGILYIFCGGLIEIYSRLAGMYDLKKGKNPYIWAESRSTKNV